MMNENQGVQDNICKLHLTWAIQHATLLPCPGAETVDVYKPRLRWK